MAKDNGKSNLSIPNPLTLWTSMESSTKKWFIGIIGAIIITAMVTGNFETLLGLFK